MPKINHLVIVHKLKVDRNFKLVFHKRRVLNEERYKTIDTEV